MNKQRQAKPLAAPASPGKVRLVSSLFMGLGEIVYLGNYVKGIFYALIELVALVNIPWFINKIIGLITLGTPNPGVPVTERDHSIFMMVDGILALTLLAMVIIFYVVSVEGTVRDYKIYLRSGREVLKANQKSNLIESGFFALAMSPTMILLMVFVIAPLIFSALVAFTDYSSPDHLPPANTVNWVGFQNFENLFGRDESFATALASVSTWTVIWGVLATFTTYVGGLILAELVTAKGIRFTPFFRTIFILPYAVPAMISMLVWRQMFNGSFGIINRTLIALGLIEQNIPWLSDVNLAKFVCILVNFWAGFSYFMLLALGTKASISPNIYEAANIDGCSRIQVFTKVTCPLVIRQNAPLIIMGLCHNLNNFGALFFLTGGNPAVSFSTATSAKGTDIIVTWIYNMTINLLKYNYASALAVIVFIVLVPFAIFSFVNTKSFKEGEL